MKKNKGRETKHCHRLAHLFLGKLTLSNRSYFGNLDRLDDHLKKFREEVRLNLIELSAEGKKEYRDLLLEKLDQIRIPYDELVLEQKLAKYEQERSSFPLFTNEKLNELLNIVPDRNSSQGLDPDTLTRHGLIVKLHDSFFKYWMSLKKKELEEWLGTIFREKNEAEEEPVYTGRSEIESLNKKILFLEETQVLPALESIFGDSLPDVLVDLLERPKNKIRLRLNDIYKKPSERKSNSAFEKDSTSIKAYIARKRRDHK